MPEISLLEPTVLRGVVEKLTAPESLVLLNTVPRTSWPYPTVTWDVIQGSRQVATPNIPNSEAHIVPRLGVKQESASFIYLREKKVFEPTTIHWIRTPGNLASKNAEFHVLREITDLNQRFDNFAEYILWRALRGSIVLDYPDVQATVNYHFAASHTPTVGTTWASATVAQIIADILAFKRLISRDGRVAAKDAFATELTMGRLIGAFATVGSTASGPMFLSDRMKEQFYSSGLMPGFMGLNWRVVEHVYDDVNGDRQMFVPDDELFICNLTDGRPIELIEGPTADDEAPDSYTGKFSKTWKEKDPSARQFLLEWNLLPVITRPEQFVHIADVTP